MLSGILDLIFPPRCVACRVLVSHGKAICETCRGTVSLHATLFCGACRLRISLSKQRCHTSFPYILAAATDYTGTPKDLIHALKFDLVQDAAKELGSLLFDYSARVAFPFAADIILPIPLSKRRERERGFNQAQLIGADIANRLGIPLSPSAMRRIRHTPAQSRTDSLRQRLNNLTGCFSADSSLVHGRKIIIIDDVATSGATLLEAAKTLKKAGALDILGLVCAKT